MAQVTPSDYVVGLMANAIEQQAMRPQKESVRTFTTSTSTPRALEDMIMRRNSIGANNQRLLDALKGRETWNYNLGAGLANLAPVQGYGDWGVNALRAFGGAMNRPTDAQIAREQAAQELAQKDLETALAYDKAMGETETQNQTQNIGYTPGVAGATGVNGFGVSGGVMYDLNKDRANFDWLAMKDFDEERPIQEGKDAYRNQTQLGRKIQNSLMVAGTEKENAARNEFNRAKQIQFGVARQRLRGTGAVSDFEDKKYSDDIAKIKDPVELYDYTFNWARNLGQVQKGNVRFEDVLWEMGITPEVIKAYGVPKALQKKD